MESLNAITGAILALFGGCIAFFTQRLIKQYDEFRKEVLQELKKIHTQVCENSTQIDLIKQLLDSKDSLNSIKELQRIVQEGVPVSRLDKMSKNYLNVILNRLKHIEEQHVENHGKVIWLQGEIEASHIKMRGLYKVIQAIVTKSPKPQEP